MALRSRFAAVSLAALAAPLVFAAPALAEPTDPVVIGWWSYFTPEGPMYQVPTTDPAHPVTAYGDPDTYYYEPSGGHGLQDASIPPDTAWQSIIQFTLANTNGATLAPDFTIDTSSDLNQFTQAYFGWAFVLLYVPKDKYCDSYRIHIGSVDDGVQAMANAKILGYANLGDTNKYIDMLEYGTNNLVLRPGINEVVIIHEDQQAVQRYVHDVYIEHDGVQIPLAPKTIPWGQITDSMTMKPIYQATVGVSGNGVTDSFTTGPFGFYFFDGLADGTYSLAANAGGYKQKTGNVSLALGAAATEVVRTDFALDPGCNCPSGKKCGPSGGCLDACVKDGEFGERCADPSATCVNHACVTNPCDTLTCAPNFQCEVVMQGTPPMPVATCVEVACSNVCCMAGEICSAGACVTDGCGAGCPDGQTCSGGACVDSCSVIHCVDPLVCVAGICEEPCKAHPDMCTSTASGFVGSGGSGGSGGTGGAGGSAQGPGAGGNGFGGSGGGNGDNGDSGGCGCRTAGDDRAVPWAGLALGLAGWLASRRRRSHAR